jgi:DNA invertase Pin-like site-specific DNA recombinase
VKTRRTKVVAYFRTSTDDQRLGIDAQRETVGRIAADRTCTVAREFVEHESGGNNGRCELDKAIRYARRIDAFLVVAKLDRLSRDATFLMRLVDGNVPIIFGDLPEIDGSAASRMMVQMLATFAEFERRRIGERTKEALAALKRQGKRLGTPANLKPEHRRKGARNAAVARARCAVEEMADVATIAAEMRSQGLKDGQIATRLNDEGIVTRRGKDWHAIQVKRMLDRAAASR